MNTQNIYKAFAALHRGTTKEPTYFEGYSRSRTQRVWDLYAESRKAVLAHTPTRPSTRAIDQPVRDQSEDRNGGKPFGIVVGYEHPEFGLVYYVQSPQGFRASGFAESAAKAGTWLDNQTAAVAAGWTEWRQVHGNLVMLADGSAKRGLKEVRV